MVIKIHRSVEGTTQGQRDMFNHVMLAASWRIRPVIDSPATYLKFIVKFNKLSISKIYYEISRVL